MTKIPKFCGWHRLGARYWSAGLYHSSPATGCIEQQLCSWSPNSHPKALESLNCPWTSCCNFITASLRKQKIDNNQRVVPQEDTFTSQSLSQGPERMQNSWSLSGLHIGLSVPFRQDLLWRPPVFFSIWKQFWHRAQAELTTVAPPRQMVHPPHYCSIPVAEPPTHVPGHLGHWGSHRWDVQEPVDIPPSLKSLCSDRQREDQESPASCRACLGVQFQQFVSLTLPDIPIPGALVPVPGVAHFCLWCGCRAGHSYEVTL